MALWQVTSYRAALDTEQRRLLAQYQLRHRYGQDWYRHVPDDVAWMLRDGVLLDETFECVAEIAGEADRSAKLNGPAAWTDEELSADMRARLPNGVERPVDMIGKIYDRVLDPSSVNLKIEEGEPSLDQIVNRLENTPGDFKNLWPYRVPS